MHRAIQKAKLLAHLAIQVTRLGNQTWVVSTSRAAPNLQRRKAERRKEVISGRGECGAGPTAQTGRMADIGLGTPR